MSRRIRAARGKADENQAGILADIAEINKVQLMLGDPGNIISVQNLSPVGDGCPDLLIGFRRVNYLVEIKNPKKPGAGLNSRQDKFFAEWKGQAHVAYTTGELLKVIGFTGITGALKY